MLIHCKECEHNCSDKVDVCPNCGCPLKAPPTSMTPDERVARTARSMGVTFAIFIVMFLGLSMFTSCWDGLVGLMGG